jgi:hypothetical protein
MKQEQPQPKDQKSEQENFKKFKEEQAEKGVLIVKPKVVYDGTCKHFFVEDGIDGEGKGQAACKNCWQGVFYNLDTQKVSKDGRVINS